MSRATIALFALALFATAFLKGIEAGGKRGGRVLIDQPPGEGGGMPGGGGQPGQQPGRDMPGGGGQPGQQPGMGMPGGGGQPGQQPGGGTPGGSRGPLDNADCWKSCPYGPLICIILCGWPTGGQIPLPP